MNCYSIVIIYIQACILISGSIRMNTKAYKGICLESRYPRYRCSSGFTFSLAVGTYGSLQLSIQPWICAPGTHYNCVDRGSVEYEVCPTPLHMATTGNRTPDLLILSPTPYPLSHRMLKYAPVTISYDNMDICGHVEL